MRVIIISESQAKILAEEPNKTMVKPNTYVYHKSNPIFREKISLEGLVPKGKSETWLANTDIEGKVIFATNSDNQNDWFDSTYDDDIYQINTTKINNKWFLDPNFLWGDYKYKHIITFEPIPINAIKLIHKGTGKDPLVKESYYYQEDPLLKQTGDYEYQPSQSEIDAFMKDKLGHKQYQGQNQGQSVPDTKKPKKKKIKKYTGKSHLRRLSSTIDFGPTGLMYWKLNNYRDNDPVLGKTVTIHHELTPEYKKYLKDNEANNN
jgi:hypothetical protein